MWWADHLPSIVEAFFVIDAPGSRDASGGTGLSKENVAKARGAHSKFLSRYGLRADEVPLLRLRLADWDAPFKPFD